MPGILNADQTLNYETPGTATLVYRPARSLGNGRGHSLPTELQAAIKPYPSLQAAIAAAPAGLTWERTPSDHIISAELPNTKPDATGSTAARWVLIFTPAVIRTCKRANCTEPREAKQTLCLTHVREARRQWRQDAITSAVNKPCNAGDCTEPRYRDRGLCQDHERARQRRIDATRRAKRNTPTTTIPATIPATDPVATATVIALMQEREARS